MTAAHSFSHSPKLPVEAAKLRELGYEPELHRSLGTYSSFATGFSFVSILTTVFQLFGFGYSFAGPAFFWTWPIVFLGQLLVAFLFAELSARWPVSGCIYQWSTRLAGATLGWFAGWLMLIGQVVTLAAAAVALQAVLPLIWSGFELVPGSASVTSSSGATNAVLLGVILLALCTLVNASGIKLTALLSSTGMTLELLGIVLLISIFFAHLHRGPIAAVHPLTPAPGMSGILASSLMAAYVFVGFDSAAEMAEETLDPQRTAPRTIIQAVVASGVLGTLMLLTTLMAAPSLAGDGLASQGIAYVILADCGKTVAIMLLVLVCIAIAVCTLAIQAATTRMTFSMARDRVLPGSKALCRVSERTGTPVIATVLIGVLAAGVLLINVGDAGLFATLASVCIMLLYLAYLCVSGSMLAARIRGTWCTPDGDDRFSLGRAGGLVVNVGAVIFGVLMTLNLAWPRSAVFDPSGSSPWMVWAPLMFLAVTLLIGFVIHRGLNHERGVKDPEAEV